MPETQAKLDRARGYPYSIPERSYTWRAGAVAEFDASACARRTPVLAIGSNQSPQQLSRKFGIAAEIPVQRARLSDFDIYYSAHITSYGSVPAMLQRAPGARVSLSVTWLDDRQLEIMHATELAAANYRYAAIENVELALDHGGTMEYVHAYVGVHGHLVHDDDAVALAAVSAEGRRPKALTTAEVLELVRERVAPDDSPDQFVLKLIDDRTFRAYCSKSIASDAVAFGHPIRNAKG